MALWNRHSGLRFAMAAFAAPMLAIYATIWVFSGYDFYYLDRPLRVNFENSMMVLYLTVFYSLIAGWPVMLFVMMPYFVAMRRRRKTNLVYFLVPGFVAGLVIATLYFGVLFSRADAKAIFYPTLAASMLTMLLAWLLYIVGDPNYPHGSSSD